MPAQLAPPLEDQHHRRAFGLIFLALIWKKDRGHEGHLSAQELVSAVADVAEDRWGLMAHIVLEHLGAGSKDAIGQIVEEMLDLKFLRRSDDDSLEDFAKAADLTIRFELARYPWRFVGQPLSY